jgi:subtilisin family serine protease
MRRVNHSPTDIPCGTSKRSFLVIIVRAAIACLLLFFLSSCVKKNERVVADADRPYRITYSAKLLELKKAFANEKADIDKTIRYSPGYVGRLDPATVVHDETLGVDVVEGEFVVEMEAGHGDKDLLRRLRAKGIECSIVGCVPTFNLYQVRVKDYGEKTLEKIKSIRFVKDAFRHFARQAEDAATTPAASFWHIANYGIESIWKFGKGKGAVIAIIDTGIDLDPLHFQDRIIFPYSVVTRSASFEDGVFTKDGDRMRVIGHGTQVASLAAGYLPERGYSGIAPEARIMPIQAFGYSVKEDKIVGDDLAIIEGIARAIAFRADVVNLSLGSDYAPLRKRYANGDGTYQSAMYSLMDAHVARTVAIYARPLRECFDRKIHVVCSAGNDGLSAKIQPLSASQYTISVGAIDSGNVLGAFSNRGETVACYAPGVDVPVASAGESIFKVSGTSFSAPFVSGIVAIAAGAGLGDGPQSYRQALSSTNFQGRSSLFPGDSIEVFYPANFLRQLGAKIVDEGPFAAQFAFFRKYGDLYIEKNDSDIDIFYKIVKYYYRRNYFYENETESNWAVSKAEANFDLIFADILADRNYSYWESLVLASIPLSQQRLSQISDGISRSDFMSIIANHKGYKEALPMMLRRIASKEDRYNGNSLLGVMQFAEREKANDISVGYLRRLQAQGSQFAWDEDIACYVAAKTAERDSKAVRALLKASYKRAVATDSRRQSYFFYSALITIGDKNGITLLVKALEELDRSKSEDIAEIRRLQQLLNSSIELGAAYSFEDPAGTRKKMRNEIRNRLKESSFVDGKFLHKSLING